ncbi:MAG: alcohol dehydrogenase catalytic domain-containing protein [Bacteroidota bacterium]
MFPSLLGLEGSGVIEPIGADVTEWKVGDAVCLLPNMDNTRYGYLGAFALTPQEAVLPEPASLSFVEAAAFWIAYGVTYPGGRFNRTGAIRYCH